MDITPDLLLRAYASGAFPMAESRDSEELFWLQPERRGIFPLDGFHISRSLRRRLRSGEFTVSTNLAFEAVVEGCADRPDTWINATIFALYQQLHQAGFAHSLEVWDGSELAGGVYGVSLGSGFFGESMFSRRTDASKVALAYLVDRLRLAGFTLFDTQFLTPHLASLGAIEIDRDAYEALLARALQDDADFNAPGAPPEPHSLLQRSSQTS